jgi:uncharacterized protein (UPF0335 family)
MPDTLPEHRLRNPVFGAPDVDGKPGALLKQHVEAIERLEQEKADIADAIKERYAALKGDGFDPKAVKAIIAERKKKPEEVSEFDMLIDTYKAALGMLPSDSEEE